MWWGHCFGLRAHPKSDETYPIFRIRFVVGSNTQENSAGPSTIAPSLQICAKVCEPICKLLTGLGAVQATLKLCCVD